MSELVDEAEALQANMDGLGKLSDSLKTFNDSFASLLYVMDMNALTIDWPQVRVRQAERVGHPSLIPSQLVPRHPRTYLFD